jgi:hypothetical protein
MNDLTMVELTWIEKRIERWIRFGKIEQALRQIDAVEQLDIKPEDAAPDHWRHVHNRLTAGETPRSYTRTMHAAWTLRRRAGA